MHLKSEQEKLALIGFVREIDSQFSLTHPAPSRSNPASSFGPSTTVFKPTLSPLAENTRRNIKLALEDSPSKPATSSPLSKPPYMDSSPIKMTMRPVPSLFDMNMREDGDEEEVGDVSFGDGVMPVIKPMPLVKKVAVDKENMPM